MSKISFKTDSGDPERETTVTQHGNVIFVEGFYPRSECVPIVEYDLCHVRAMGGIRIQFDFERNEYLVFQRYYFDDMEQDIALQDKGLDTQTWVEVGAFPAFLEAPIGIAEANIRDHQTSPRMVERK